MFAVLMVLNHHIVASFSTPIPLFRYMLVFTFPLFFVGSGFFIGQILFRNWQITGQIELFTFYKRRILRTWPTYFVGLLLTWWSWPKGMDIPYFEYYFIFLQNFFFNPQSGAFYFHSWSLAIEEQFYLLCPFLMMVLVRAKKPNLIFAFLFLSSILLRLYLNLTMKTEYHHTLLWSDALLMGVFLSVPDNRKIIDFISKHALVIQIGSVIAGLILIRYRFWIPNTYMQFLFIFSTLFAFSCYKESSFLSKFFASRIFYVLNKRSYGYFIFHMLAIHLIKPFSFSEIWINYVGSIILTALFGELSWRLIEKPLLQKREQWFPMR